MTPELEITIGIWLFVLGACVGSFLNVVIYRVPAGLSIVHPGSHCPKCRKAIRWHDNLPIVGWLVLRGRCRDCKLPISWRYPAVEAFVASMFLLLAVFELFTLAGNLPRELFGTHPPPAGYDFVDAALVYSYHIVLLCTLFCAAMIRLDGANVPIKLLLPAVLVGSLTWFFVFEVHPIGPVFIADTLKDLEVASDEFFNSGQRFLELGRGWACGMGVMLFGRNIVFWKTKDRPDTKADPFIFGTIGLFVGTFTVTMIAFVAASLHLAVSIVARLRNQSVRKWFPAIAFAVTSAWIIGWEFWIARFGELIDSPALLPITLGVVVVTITFVAITERVDPVPSRSE